MFNRIKKHTKQFACFGNYAYLCKRNQKWFCSFHIAFSTLAILVATFIHKAIAL